MTLTKRELAATLYVPITAEKDLLREGARGCETDMTTHVAPGDTQKSRRPAWLELVPGSAVLPPGVRFLGKPYNSAALAAVVRSALEHPHEGREAL